MNNIDDLKTSIDNFAKMWDDAVKKDIFNNENAKSPQKKSSFFGLDSGSNNTELDDEDSKDWNDLYKGSQYHHDDSMSASNLIYEEEMALNASKIEKVGNFNGNAPSKPPLRNPAKIAKKIIKAPNPIRQSTTGSDADNIGITYTNEDLNKLADLKDKLYELECDLNKSDAKAEDKKSTNLSSRLLKLKKEIDKLSNSLDKGQTISQQGD